MNPFRLVLLMGLISLFSDMTYEGARSITGPYLSILGATGFAVSFIAGFGEFLGYTLRLFSGYLVDKTKKYWTMTLVGYFVNLVSVPLIGFATSWQSVSVLIFSERIGKAIRVPARDTIISYAARSLGAGKSYGIHEALDTIGGLIGPLFISILLYWNIGYRGSFLVLFIPAIIAMAILLSAQRNFPNPELLEPEQKSSGKQNITIPLWMYIVAVSFVGMGFSDFPLIAFHVKKQQIMADGSIPLLYSLTMVVAAFTALYFGRLFDQIGLFAVIAGVGCSTLFSYFAFLGGITGVIIGFILWGIGTGIQESIMRASIANMMHASVRGRAFGLFNATYGILSFIGSAIMGYLYDLNIIYLVIFSIASHIIALLILLLISGKNFNGAKKEA